MVRSRLKVDRVTLEFWHQYEYQCDNAVFSPTNGAISH